MSLAFSITRIRDNFTLCSTRRETGKREPESIKQTEPPHFPWELPWTVVQTEFAEHLFWWGWATHWSSTPPAQQHVCQIRRVGSAISDSNIKGGTLLHRHRPSSRLRVSTTPTQTRNTSGRTGYLGATAQYLSSNRRHTRQDRPSYSHPGQHQSQMTQTIILRTPWLASVNEDRLHQGWATRGTMAQSLSSYLRQPHNKISYHHFNLPAHPTCILVKVMNQIHKVPHIKGGKGNSCGSELLKRVSRCKQILLRVTQIEGEGIDKRVDWTTPWWRVY